MSTKVKILIGLAVLAVVVLIIFIVIYNKNKGSNLATMTTTTSRPGIATLFGSLVQVPENMPMTFSDERLKKNIELSGLNKSYNNLDKINIIEYSLVRADGSMPCMDCDRRRIGFSAQQLEEIDPNLVFVDPKSGFRMIDLSQLTAMNTASIKVMQENMAYLKGLVSSDAVQGGGPTNTRVM